MLSSLNVTPVSDDIQAIVPSRFSIAAVNVTSTGLAPTTTFVPVTPVPDAVIPVIAGTFSSGPGVTGSSAPFAVRLKFPFTLEPSSAVAVT